MPAGSDLAPIAKQFQRGDGYGVFRLGATEPETLLPGALGFWRDVGRAFVLRLCATEDLEALRAKVEVDVPPDELAALVAVAPPMTGGEYLTPTVLADLCTRMAAAVQDELVAWDGTVEAFLRQASPAWNLVGRVCFHLVQRATRTSAVTKDLVEAGAVFQTLAWTPAEAHRFLTDVPLIEAAGVVVRMPPGLVLSGETEVKKRAGLVEQFQRDEGPPFFVLSLKAGGTGLNLTAARHVIHFDRWWNPAVESQATDRAYRIGQRSGVLVNKFVCRGTIEEKIDALIESKQDLARQIPEGTDEVKLTELDDDQLLGMVALDIRSALAEG